MTPSLHQAEGEALGLSYAYERFDTAHDSELAQVILLAEARGYAGLNVTHPHKQKVIALLDRLEGAAEEIQSVNTVVFRDQSRVGMNTDYAGFRHALRQEIGSVAGQCIRQLGAGGAGSAVALALLDSGVDRLSLFDPDKDRSLRLKARLEVARPKAVVDVLSAPDADAASIEGVVNCTPLGMAATPGTPIDPSIFSPQSWAADIVYFPRETAFLNAATAHGMQVMDGTQMALWQAVEAFAVFTQSTPDPARMGAHLARLIESTS